MVSNTKSPHTPKQDRAIETRKKIIAAGKKMFSEKGYFKTNSKEIAREAGVSIGTFYIYFDDKKPLFVEIYNLYYKEIVEAVVGDDISVILNETDPRKLVHLLIKKIADAHTLSPQFHREAMAMKYMDKDIMEINKKQEQQVFQLLKSLLENHKDKLKINDMDAAVHIIHIAIDEIIHSLRIFAPPICEENIIDELEEMIFNYLF